MVRTMPGGRPPKYADKGTDARKEIRCRSEDLEAWDAQAKKEGVSLSEWIILKLNAAAKNTRKKRK